MCPDHLEGVLPSTCALPRATSEDGSPGAFRVPPGRLLWGGLSVAWLLPVCASHGAPAPRGAQADAGFP